MGNYIDKDFLNEIRARFPGYPIIEPLQMVESKTLTGSGTGQITRNIADNEILVLTEILFTSTGAFTIESYDTGRGSLKWYQDGAIPKAILARDNNYILSFQFPFVVKPGTIYHDLVDTSTSSNTVQMLLMGVKLKKSN